MVRKRKLVIVKMCVCVCSEMLVKQLVPLGFSRSRIRKELSLSEEGPEAVALKLLTQQQEGKGMVVSGSSDGSTEEEGSVAGVAGKEKEEGSGKVFVIEGSQVSLGEVQVQAKHSS